MLYIKYTIIYKGDFIKMIIAVIIFLFVLYCILETCKYNKLTYEVINKKNKELIKKKKNLNRNICYIKIAVYLTLYTLVIINHFSDPLSKSGGIRSLIILLVPLTFFLIICIIDVVKVRNNNAKNK